MGKHNDNGGLGKENESDLKVFIIISALARVSICQEDFDVEYLEAPHNRHRA